MDKKEKDNLLNHDWRLGNKPNVFTIGTDHSLKAKNAIAKVKTWENG